MLRRVDRQPEEPERLVQKKLELEEQEQAEMLGRAERQPGEPEMVLAEQQLVEARRRLVERLLMGRSERRLRWAWPEMIQREPREAEERDLGLLEPVPAPLLELLVRRDGLLQREGGFRLEQQPAWWLVCCLVQRSLLELEPKFGWELGFELLVRPSEF